MRGIFGPSIPSFDMMMRGGIGRNIVLQTVLLFPTGARTHEDTDLPVPFGHTCSNPGMDFADSSKSLESIHAGVQNNQKGFA